MCASAWLARDGSPARPAPATAAPAPPPVPAAAAVPAPSPLRSAPRDPRPMRSPRRPTTGTGPRTVYSSGPRTIPGEILLPRTRRRATPMRFILIGGAILFALIAALYLAGRAPAPPVPSSLPAAGSVPPAPTTAVEDRGPLSHLEPELRRGDRGCARELPAARWRRRMPRGSRRPGRTSRPPSASTCSRASRAL